MGMSPGRVWGGRLGVLAVTCGLLVGTGSRGEAQQLDTDAKATMLLRAGQDAYNQKNLPFAQDRYREFLKQYGSHKDAVWARYGLGVILLELPDKDFTQAVEQLTQPAGLGEFPERPYAQYYLGLAYRGQGHLALAQAAQKTGAEAASLRQTALQRFDQAQLQFLACLQSLQAKIKGAPPAEAGKLTDDMEWLARCRCDQAEMLLQAGKYKEGAAAVEPLLKDPLYSTSKYRKLAVYSTGYSLYLQKEYIPAARLLVELTPFDDPVYGLHARYLLGRTHHLAEERAEAANHYSAVVAGYDALKVKAAADAKNPQLLAQQKMQIEALLKNPAPDYVARAAFFSGILAYEQGRFAEGAAQFTKHGKDYPNSPFLKEAELRLGLCQVQLKAFAEALKTLQPLVEHPQLSDQALFWLARAQVGMTEQTINPAQNLQQYKDGLKPAQDNLRRAGEKANALIASDPAAKNRRGDALLELADVQQLAGLYAEAAATYQTVIQENHAAPRVEQAAERQVAAWQLAGKFKETDDAVARFQQLFPKSTLLGGVLFRHAENAYLTAVATAGNPALANREQEAAKFYTEAIKRFQLLLDKFPEYPYINLARWGLANSYYQLGKFEEAAKTLAQIPDADRSNKLATTSLLQADCVIRTFPTDAGDALAAAKLAQQVEQAVKLLDAFIGSAGPLPEVAEALLKLGYCHQQMASIMGEPAERNKSFATARLAYERLIKDFSKSPYYPQAVFERARCLAEQNDVGTAINELTKFQSDAVLKSAPIAPLALVRLASLHRAGNRAAEAVKILQGCRDAHEAALLKDPARLSWAPLVQYHLGLALRETGKLPEARAMFENLVKQFAGRPEVAEAAWRAGQVRREEQLLKLEAARKVLAKSDAKPEEKTAAANAVNEVLKELVAIAQYFQDQAKALATSAAGSEPQLRMYYEAAWALRPPMTAEIENARKAIEQDLLKKRQEELAKKAAPGEQVPPARIAEILPAAIPVQPSEQKIREMYVALIGANEEHPLAHDAKFELAEWHARRDEHAAAIKLLTAVLDVEPAPYLAERVRLRLGDCLLATKDFTGAFGQFQAVASNAKSLLAAEARYRAGEALMMKEDWAGAMAQLTPFRDKPELHNVAGVSDRALLRLGHALAHAGQWDASRQAFEQHVSRYPQSVWHDEARYGIGWAWQNQKQFDNAAQAYAGVTNRTAAEVAAKAQLQIGLCRLEQKRFAEAASALLVVPFTYDYPEWSATALVEAARALLELKQPDQAKRLLDRVMKDYPTSKLAEVAKQRLGEIKE